MQRHQQSHGPSVPSPGRMWSHVRAHTFHVHAACGTDRTSLLPGTDAARWVDAYIPTPLYSTLIHSHCKRGGGAHVCMHVDRAAPHRCWRASCASYRTALYYTHCIRCTHQPRPRPAASCRRPQQGAKGAWARCHACGTVCMCPPRMAFMHAWASTSCPASPPD